MAVLEFDPVNGKCWTGLMLENSQSALRLIALFFFAAFFAGAWANDQPRGVMAQKDPPPSTTILSQELPTYNIISLTIGTQVSTQKPAAASGTQLIDHQPEPARHGMMTITAETRGLKLEYEIVKKHLQQLPIGISNGDYLMVDGLGGIGWLRIRGQDAEREPTLQVTTQVAEQVVRYVFVEPSPDSPQENAPVPVPAKYASEPTATTILK